MTESCFAIRGNAAHAGGRGALLKQPSACLTKQNQNMNRTISAKGDAAFNVIMADLSLDFAESSVHRIGFDIDDCGIQLLSERYSDRVFRSRRWSKGGQLSWRSLLLRFDHNAYVLAYGDGHNWGEIFAPDAEIALRLHRDVGELLKRNSPRHKRAFYMLRYDYSEIEADPVDNLPESLDAEFLRLCYGEDIVTWIEKFHETTIAHAGGLTIFEGPSGTGKTSLITQMINELEKTHVFYVLPVARDSALSSPELVPFWQRQNQRHADRVKVIVLEDAERLLWRRDGGNCDSVTSLLNIADGLMGRMLRLHVIASINARLEDLDPAIVRPGRLMLHRRFNLLPRATAELIAAKRKTAFRPRSGVSEYTLAEILNPGPKHRSTEKRSIGFRTPMTV